MTTSAQEEQKLRKSLAGSTTTQTYHSRAAADIALENQGGRFAKGAEVTGSKPAVVYPRQPEGSPWAGDLVPPEGPLGYSVQDDIEPNGTPQEVESSLLAASSALSPGDAAEEATEGHTSGRPAPSALLPLAAEGVPSLLRRARRL
jgi:hypothetical protein